VRIVRRAAREEARQAVQDALRDAPGADPAFAPKPRAARILGVSRATVGRWQKAGRITRYEGGRVSLAECRRVLAGESSAPAVKAPPVADLAAERARRAAATLRRSDG
jgi:hypothetical protein